jgi:hypothetical protein
MELEEGVGELCKISRMNLRLEVSLKEGSRGALQLAIMRMGLRVMKLM